MKQNRRIPFGYCMENAGVGIDENEAAAVQEIFEQYVAGKTLKQICDHLNDEGIPYYESNPVWNKPMVHRLLGNPKYVGDDIYPRIIEPELFEAAASQANSRQKFRPPACPSEKALQHKIFCACGSRLAKDEGIQWRCHSCSEMQISEKSLTDLLCEAFRQIGEDPSVIIVEPKEKEYAPSVEIMKLNNDIRRQIDSRETNADEIKADILRCALLKYESFEEDLTPYISKTLCEEFEKGGTVENACIPLIEKTVASITLAKPGKIQIKLRNGAMIAAGRR